MARSCLTIILAAGQGTRMKSALPKVLHPVAGLPMAAHVAATARAAGSDAVAIVYGHGGEAVRDALAEAINDTTALVAAELVGLSERAFEIVLDYIKTREQFDKPIGSFQVIQHRAVDLNVMCEVAQSGVREALGLMDGETDPKTRARLASRAKARAVTAARKITRDAIQLHGAVGYTDEFDIGLYLNRALVLSAWLGDDAYHRRLWFEAREQEGAAQ